MSKVITTIIKIAGEVSGSLMSAIATTANAMKGLKNAARVDPSNAINGNRLQAKLEQLKQWQQQYQRLKQATDRAMMGSVTASSRASEGRREYERLNTTLQRLGESIRQMKAERDRLQAGDPRRQQLTEQLRAQREQYQATLSLRAQQALSTQLKERGAAAASAEYQRQAAALQRLQSMLNASGIAAHSFASAQADLSRRIAGTTEELQKQSKKWLNAAKHQHLDANQHFSNTLAGMSTSEETAQQMLSPFIEATKTAKTYEAELSRSKALTQMDHINEGNIKAIEAEMAMLDARYKEIGRTTQFTATQAAGAGNYLAMAGWDANKINAGLPSVVNLAIASGSGVESAADILSNIQTGFGYETDAESIQHLADVLTYTVTHSNQNLQQLGDTMKYVAPVAKMFGSSVEETAALTKFMADAGIQGSMAGTSLRATMLRLVAPPKKASKAMQENGITVDDAAKAWVNANETAAEYGITLDQGLDVGHQMISIIEQINTNMAGLSTHEKMAAFAAITGVNAVSGAMNIFEQDPAKITEFTALLEDASKGEGAAAQTAGIMADNFQGSLISMQSALESVQIAVGNAFLPMLKGAADAVTPLIRSTSEFAAAHPGVIRAIGGLTAAIAGGIVALGAFNVALAGMKLASATMNLMKATAAFEMFAATSGGAATAFGRLSLAASAFKTSGLAAGFKALGSAAMAALTGIGTAMKGLLLNPWVLGITVALMLLVANWDKVSAAASKAWEVMSKIFGRMGEGLGTIFDGITSALESSGLMSVLESVLDKLGLIEKKKSVLDQRESLPQEMSEMVSGELRMESDELDELTRSTRSILRNVEGKTNEQIAEEIWSKMSEEKQTDAAQRQQSEMLRSELSRRKDISDESRAAIESVINEKQHAARESAIEPLIKKFDELAGKQDLKSEADRDAFLSMAKETLSKEEGLGAGEREEIYGRVKAGIEERSAASSYSEELKALTSGASLKTLSEQSEMVSKVLNETSGSAASMSTRFEEFGKWLKGQEQLSQSARETMAAEYREGLQEQMTSRLSEGISAALTKANESEKVSALTELISSQKDQSVLAVEMMMKSVESGLKKSGYEGDDLKALVSEVRSGVKEAVSAREKSEAASSYAEAPKLPEVKVEVKPTAGLNPYEYRPWEMQMGAMSSAAAEREFAVQSGASTSMFEMLSNLLFSKGEATAPSGAAEINASTLELSAAISNAAAEQSAASAQVNASTMEMTAGLTQVNVTAQATGVELQNVGMNGQLASQGMQQVSDGSLQASASVVALAGSTDGAQAGMAAVAGASNSASGALGGLGSAASSAISALMSAASSAGSAVMNAAGEARAALSSLFSGGEPAHNAVGGIYPRGEFLTTFAEDSAEAAIPIKKGDSNAISLWQRTGAMLGVLGGQQPSLPMSSMSNGYISDEMARQIGQYSNEVRKSKSYESMRRAQRARTFSDEVVDASSKNPSMMKSGGLFGGLFGGISPMMSALPSMSNGIISDEMARQGTYSDAVRKSKSYEAMDRARRARTFSDEVVDASSKTPSMMKAGGLFGGLSPMMSALQSSNALQTSSESLSSKLQTYDQLEQQSMSLSTTTNNDQSMPPITLHFHFDGAVNREDVQKGVEESLPSIRETFEQQMAKYRHEVSRRSF